jgi:hypothetical protein
MVPLSHIKKILKHYRHSATQNQSDQRSHSLSPYSAYNPAGWWKSETATHPGQQPPPPRHTLAFLLKSLRLSPACHIKSARHFATFQIGLMQGTSHAQRCSQIAGSVGLPLRRAGIVAQRRALHLQRRYSDVKASVATQPSPGRCGFGGWFGAFRPRHCCKKLGKKNLLMVGVLSLTPSLSDRTSTHENSTSGAMAVSEIGLVGLAVMGQVRI